MKSNKSKLFIISGSMATSKDTTLNELSNRGVIKTLLSTTTRPKRPFEQQGREYNFVTEEEFDKKDFVEKRLYRVANGDTWYYGLSYDEIFKCYDIPGNYAVILDVQGMRKLKRYINRIFGEGIEVITVMLQASYYTRLKRYLNRDKIDDELIKECCRRMLADSEEVEKYSNEYDVVLKSEDEDLERNIKIIKSLCE